MEQKKKRTWAEIDLGALEHNYRALRAILPEGCRFLGVVKANAYGHGALAVARCLEQLGADYLAVATVDEGAELRAAGITLPVLVLGPTPVEFAADLVRLRLTQSVSDLETARAYSAAAQAEDRDLRIHIKTDTGMSRLGFLCDEAHTQESAQAIAEVCALPRLKAEGIFTHFSDADEGEAFTRLQFENFRRIISALEERGVSFAIRHCAASPGTLRFAETHMEMVRPGLALYGHYPAESCAGTVPGGLRPVMRFKTRVAALRDLPAGAAVSYGRTRVLDHDTRVAVLPVGYGDGLSRHLSNCGTVWLGGQDCPILGRVCMDLCMVEAPENVQVGDEVELFGEHSSLEHMAELVGTIPYELLCDVSRRVPRVIVR